MKSFLSTSLKLLVHGRVQIRLSVVDDVRDAFEEVHDSCF